MLMELSRPAPLGAQSSSPAASRSSPARPAASASASPARSPRPAPPSCSTASARPTTIGEIARRARRPSTAYAAIYSPADMTKPAAIARMVDLTLETLRAARHPGQQRRHPARRADRGVPGREVGRDHRHQPVVRLPHHPPCACRRCARPGWGRIINVASAHGLVASPFKAAYVAAKHGIVGLTKVDGARDAPRTASPATRSARATSGRRWSRRRSTTRQSRTASRASR